MDGKTVVVLAGYTQQMHEMLQLNPGLKSRFASIVEFADCSVGDCMGVVQQVLGSSTPAPFVLADAVPAGRLEDGFRELMGRPGWANGRDCVEMCNKLIRQRDLRAAKAS